jgi:hypothetical protein
MRVKGTGVRLPTNPDKEPNFYALPPITENMVAALPTPEVSSMPTAKQDEKDIVFFEGCPFHYLEPSSLPPVPPLVTTSFDVVDSTRDVEARKRPSYGKASSVVSDSDSAEDPYVPSFSAPDMDWEGPLAYVRRSSFQSFAKDAPLGQPSLDDDIDTFFQSFNMPVDRYHAAIEMMSDHDDTAFGYLLEQAISE